MIASGIVWSYMVVFQRTLILGLAHITSFSLALIVITHMCGTIAPTNFRKAVLYPDCRLCSAGAANRRVEENGLVQGFASFLDMLIFSKVA